MYSFDVHLCNVLVYIVVPGDAAYGLDKNLICPYPGDNLPRHKEVHNHAHSSTRMVVERSFADIKNRWLRLRSLRSDIPFANRIIAACCCLHNMCIEHGDIEPTPRPIPEPSVGNHHLQFDTACMKRDAIANHIVANM